MPVNPVRALVVASLLFAGAVGLAACGSSGDETSSGAAPAPAAGEFPPADGQDVVDLAKDIGLTHDIVVSPAGQTYEPGKNRFGFGVFNADASEIDDAEIALYAAHGSSDPAEGPFPARIESLKTEPAFASETASAEPVTVAYVSEMTFDKPGEWRLTAVIKQGDQLVASLLPSITVGAYPKIPDVGEVPHGVRSDGSRW